MGAGLVAKGFFESRGQLCWEQGLGDQVCSLSVSPLIASEGSVAVAVAVVGGLQILEQRVAAGWGRGRTGRARYGWGSGKG